MIGFLISALALVSSSPENSFENEVERIYRELDLPGLAAVVRQGDEITVNVAHGFADFGPEAPLTTDHLFWSASVTKAATAYAILLEGYDLDSPWSEWTDHSANYHPDTQVWHLISQTSEGPHPGERFIYGYRFNALYELWGSGADFRNSLVTRVITPLLLNAQTTLSETAQNDLVVMPQTRDEFGAAWTADQDSRWASAIPATNLMISPRSLAKLGMAMNRCIGLTRQQCNAVNTAPRLTDGSPSPYGLGSFVEQVGDVTVVWQYGFGQSESALMVRVPERDLAIAIMSNASDLSASARLGSGSLIRHPLGEAIIRYLIDLDPDYNLEGERALNDLLRADAGFETSDRSSIEARTRAALAAYPDVFQTPSEPLIYLLSRRNDPVLLEHGIGLGEEFLILHPEHPWVMESMIHALFRLGQRDRAETYQARLCASNAYADHATRSEFC